MPNTVGYKYTITYIQNTILRNLTLVKAHDVSQTKSPRHVVDYFHHVCKPAIMKHTDSCCNGFLHTNRSIKLLQSIRSTISIWLQHCQPWTN